MEKLKQLEKIGINPLKLYWNLTESELITQTLIKKQGTLTSTGSLATGEFNGRTPKDKYIVQDSLTADTIWWSDVNHPLSPDDYDSLYDRLTAFLSNGELYVKDIYTCVRKEYQLNLRVITQTPWQSLFANNLFLRPSEKELAPFEHEWLVLAAPEFKANPEEDKTGGHNFTIINFTKKVILIGGSAYTGEIKKGIFTVLNYILPCYKNVFLMHCSANIGIAGDISLFFGLSGTGKTTLSSDFSRKLIGDDEHGWDNENVFNLKGGWTPKNIFFLTCDAFGVLPPISKLSASQAMYHFVSGYTTKLAVTETGDTEPQTIFSACFDRPFLPLHPIKYAELLGEKLKINNVNVWLVNTGWTGGSYGIGQRIKLSYTRTLITAVHKGKFNGVAFVKHPVFGLSIPARCEGVPSVILNPEKAWGNKSGYGKTARALAKLFAQNFRAYEHFASEDIMSGAPNVYVF